MYLRVEKKSRTLKAENNLILQAKKIDGRVLEGGEKLFKIKFNAEEKDKE